MATLDTWTPRRRFSARDACLVVLIAAAVLLLSEGTSIRSTGQEMERGALRTLVLAVGEPAGWVAERLPFAAATDQVTGWLSPDSDLGSDDGRFAGLGPGGTGGGASRVSPSAFDASTLGGSARAKPALRSLLVTGDSMVMPLDAILSRALTGDGVRAVRDPHVGTGISKTDLVDWGRLAGEQAAEHRPDAVVVFLGANEGFPMRSQAGRVACCGPEWAAEYATRVRAVLEHYVRARTYWVTLPAPRDPDRRRIAAAVNAALRVAVAPYGAQVRLVDAAAIFTPGGRYRDAMEIAGRRRLVREADGIHLSTQGAEVLADRVLATLRRDFAIGS